MVSAKFCKTNRFDRIRTVSTGLTWFGPWATANRIDLRERRSIFWQELLDDRRTYYDLIFISNNVREIIIPR